MSAAILANIRGQLLPPVTNPAMSLERPVWRAADLIHVALLSTSACISGKRVAHVFIRVRFRATTRVFGQMVVFFAFIYGLVAKCTDVSEERPVCIFRVTTVFKVNAEVIQ